MRLHGRYIHSVMTNPNWVVQYLLERDREGSHSWSAAFRLSDTCSAAVYIDTDPPPAKQYKSIGELLGLYCTSRRAQRGMSGLRVMAVCAL